MITVISTSKDAEGWTAEYEKINSGVTGRLCYRGQIVRNFHASVSSNNRFEVAIGQGNTRKLRFKLKGEAK